MSCIFDKKANLRKILSGFRSMRKTGGSRVYRNLLGQVSLTPLPICEKQCSKFFFGHAYRYVEIAARQLLVTRLRQRLHNAVCISYENKKPISLPLPPSWQDQIEKSGVKVDRLYCSVSFCFFLVSIFLVNIIRSAFSLYQSLTHIPKSHEPGGYLFFLNLKDSNLPKYLAKSEGGTDIDSTYDICSWFYIKEDKDNIGSIGHDLPIAPYLFKDVLVRRVFYPWLHLKGLEAKSNLLTWWFRALFVSFYNCLLGRWWYGALLEEATKSYATSLANQNTLAKKYLFPYSASIFRPLWTYIVELRGKEVCAYFYSTYAQPMTKAGLEGQAFEFGAVSWSSVLVWTQEQKQRLANSCESDRLNIQVCGPIWFTDTPVSVITQSIKKYISVFPDAFYRLRYQRGISTFDDWFFKHPNIYTDFLNDIHCVLTEYGYHMLIKLKREFGNFRPKSSFNLNYQLQSQGGVTFINPSISAFRLNKLSNAAIALPFTSAALCVPGPTFPTVYYDPTCWIDKSDPAANGIPIISGINDLRVWINNLI